MVRTIHIILDNQDYEELTKAKGSKTWRQILLEWLRMVRTQNVVTSPPQSVRTQPLITTREA